MDKVTHQARTLSDGTMATLTDVRVYKELEAIQATFGDFCESREGQFQTWQQAWQVFLKEGISVTIDGPFANANAQSDWDEFSEWVVCFADEDNDPVGKVTYTSTHSAAWNLGQQMSTAAKMELIDNSYAQ